MKFLFKQATTFYRIRWGAILLCLGIALLARQLGVSPALFKAYLTLIAITAAFNAISHFAYRHYQRYGERYTPQQIQLLRRWTDFQTMADLVILTAAIHYTGGIHSPAIYLLVVYIAGMAMTYGQIKPVAVFSFLSTLLFTGLFIAYKEQWLAPSRVFLSQSNVPPASSFIITIISVDAILWMMALITLLQSRSLRTFWERSEKERSFLASLHHLSHDGLQYYDLTQTVQVLSQRLQDLLEADTAYVVIWEEKDDDFVPLAVHGIHHDFKKRPLSASEREKFKAGCRQVIERLKTFTPLWVQIPDKNHILPPSMQGRFQGYKSLLLLPLHAPGEKQMLGSVTLAFRSPPPDPETKTQHAQRALEVIAPLLARTINLYKTSSHLHLLQELANDVTGLTQNLNAHLVANDITESAARLLDADAAILIPFSSSSNILNQWYAAQADIHLAQPCYEYRDAYTSFFQNKNFLQLALPQDLPLLPPEIQNLCTTHDFHLLTFFTVPSPRTPVGLLILMWRSPRPFLTPHESTVGQLFAARAGAALYNAYLYTLLRQEARTDALTGLPNRRALNEALDQERKRSQRYEHPFSIAMTDINGFKAINDRFGHQTGDLTLQRIAAALKQHLRETDFIGRYGGDEFLIVFPETSYEAAQSVMGKVAHTVSVLRCDFLPEDTTLTVAYGIATYPQDADGISELIAVADKRLYENKPAG